MTDKQKELARHALGLDGRRKVSYRNRFVVGSGPPDCDEWEALVAAGDAGRPASRPCHPPEETP